MNTSTSQLFIYSDGVKIASGSYSSGTTSITVTIPAQSACKVITAKQIITAATTSPAKTYYYCLSAASNSITVTRAATTPTINAATCITYPYIFSGTSSENGATVTLYDGNNNSKGTAIVTNGTWSVEVSTPLTNMNLYAKVTSGSCLTASVNSTSIPVTTKSTPVALGYTLTINNPTIGDDVITGTISGGTYPVTVKTYINQMPIGSGVLVSSAGTWSVSGIQSNLATDQVIKVTVTPSSGCESELSSVQAVVQCAPPAIPSYTGGGSVCSNGIGSVVLDSSETGVIYQLVNSSGVAVGPTSVGNDTATVILTTYALTGATTVYVKTFRALNPSCSQTSTTAVNFTINNAVPTVTFSSTALSVTSGSSSVNLNYTAKSSSPSADKYTISFSLAAKNAGFQDVVTPVALSAVPSSISIGVRTSPVPPNGTYAGTITIYNNTSGSCTTTYGFTITVYSASTAPVITTQPLSSSICSNLSQTAILNVSAVPTPTAYQWQQSTAYNGTYTNVTGGSGGTSGTYITPALTSTTYYRVIVYNGSLYTTSNVAVVTVNTAPATPGTISGLTTVSKGSDYINYNISPVSGATSYIWSYSGNGATITGNTNSVYVSFDANATPGNLSVSAVNSCGNVAGSAPLSIAMDQICAWRTVSDGSWTTVAIWQKLDCATGTWSAASTYPNNDRPIYVYTNVTIPASTYISADSLYIKPTGIVSVPSTSALTVTDQLIVGIDVNGNSGQLNSNAACNNISTSGAKVIVRKALDSTWDFISFPFNVPETNVFLSGTNTHAIWGNISGTNTIKPDFFAARYDGLLRATGGNPSSTGSLYYVNVTEKTFTSVRGYIISGGTNGADSLDFVAANGTQITLCNGSYSPEYYINPCLCNDGWCLVGTPYITAYNLYYPDLYKSYYVAPTYTSVASGVGYKLNPFGAFFIQATGALPISFPTTGITDLATGIGPSPAPAYSNINLQLSSSSKADATLIRLNENANVKYLIGEDALKIQNAASSIQIYTEAEDACSGLSINTLPLNTEQVKLKINIANTGTCVMQIKNKENLNNIESVVLVDTETGLQTDLIQVDKYSFEANTTGTSERFYILLKTKNQTGINNLFRNNDIEVTVKGNNVSLNDLKGNANVRMYDVVGKLMYNFPNLKNNQSFNIKVPGIYFVDISTETQNKKVKILIQNEL